MSYFAWTKWRLQSVLQPSDGAAISEPVMKKKLNKLIKKVLIGDCSGDPVADYA